MMGYPVYGIEFKKCFIRESRGGSILSEWIATEGGHYD
jgi:hypothetical protein